MRAALILVALSGCFKVDPGNGKLRCAATNSRPCPTSYHCASDGTCWRNGQDPAPPDLSVGDMAGASSDGGDASAIKHKGDSCSPGDTCDTGNCTDGYCCDKPCGAACSACNLPGLLGICSPVAVGTAPVHSTCSMQDSTSCGRDGMCDGNGNCELWASGTVCGPSSCASGVFTPSSKCNCSGNCVPGAAVPCDPYLCRPDGGVCYDSCTDTGQCLSPSPCNTAVMPGSCGPKSLGASCSAGTDCKSGNCVDGLCCDMTQANCNGCRACNVTGMEGHCTGVTAGADPHNACGSVVCADKCDGSGACRAASSSTLCGVASCSNGSAIRGQFYTGSSTLTFCSGSSTGACNGSTMSGTPCPGGYLCASSTSCRTSCNVDADCTSGSFCTSSHTCALAANNGGSCNRDIECLSYHLCVSNKCVSCRTSADCIGSLGICSNGNCVSCSTGAECSAAGKGNQCNNCGVGGINCCQCGSTAECTNDHVTSCNGGPPGSCGCGSGSACTLDQQCASGACKNRTGFPCQSAGDCASGVCNGNVCG